jgi:hypothetical protein
VIGSWKATTPSPGEPPPSRYAAAPSIPGATGIAGASWWKRSTARCRKETTMMSRRAESPSTPASASALRMYSASASASVRPLISMLIGVRGNARSTCLSVGTRKSARL